MLIRVSFLLQQDIEVGDCIYFCDWAQLLIKSAQTLKKTPKTLKLKADEMNEIERISGMFIKSNHFIIEEIYTIVCPYSNTITPLCRLLGTQFVHHYVLFWEIYEFVTRDVSIGVM